MKSVLWKISRENVMFSCFKKYFCLFSHANSTGKSRPWVTSKDNIVINIFGGWFVWRLDYADCLGFMNMPNLPWCNKIYHWSKTNREMMLLKTKSFQKKGSQLALSTAEITAPLFFFFSSFSVDRPSRDMLTNIWGWFVKFGRFF